MRHHTKDKGDLGVFKAQVDLAQRGYMILMPLTEHAEFDIVAYKDNKFIRVQVKYRTMDKRGTIPVTLRTSWADRNGSHEKVVDKKAVDVFCVYCPDTDTCYYFNPRKFRKNVLLRVFPSKNKQWRRIHLASQFRRIP